MTSDGLIWKILEMESRAGRLEGLFAADTELGLMWRSQASLTEACRSVGLEDIHVFEGDVIFRHLENRLTDSEAARGAAAALELLRVIASPGDLYGDTEHVLSRCWAAAVSREQSGSEIDVAEIAPVLRSGLEDAPTPIMGAIRAATVFRMMTESQVPSADRLVFMAAEHSLRKMGHSSDVTRSGGGGILHRLNAGWIATPSTCLTQGVYRAWSPGSDTGYFDLMSGIADDLDRALGTVPLLKRWREDARSKARGRHGKSRLRDLVELAMREPILTSPYVRDMLGCSERASLYLMKQAEELGILTLITPRKSYRVWATPQMAQTLRMRVTRVSAITGRDRQVHEGEEGRDDQIPDTGTGEMSSEDSNPVEVDVVLDQESWEDRSARVLSELDDAMAQADRILAKYRKPVEK
jgi:DNA-binding Lrp family transcriptional regulator